MYIAATQAERDLTIRKVDLESEIQLIIKTIFDDFELDIDTYKRNKIPSWISNRSYTHDILMQLKNLYINTSKELEELQYDTIDIQHEDDPLFAILITHSDTKIRVEAWSNICNNYMWDERIEWIE